MRRPDGPRLILLALAVAAATTGLAACGSNDDTAGSPQTLDLKIGDLLPADDKLGDLAPSARKAAALALDQINSAIDDAGADHTVEVIDEQAGGAGDFRAAVSAANKLVSDGVSCIAGAWTDEDVTAVAKAVAVPDSVLLISPAATGDELTDLADDRLVNRTVPPESFSGSEPEASDASTAFDELFAQSDPKNVERAPGDAQTFDAVILCYLAAVAAGSTDGAEMAEALGDMAGPPGDEFTWEQLTDAIDKLENGDDIDYVGASGEIDLDKAGDPTVATISADQGASQGSDAG